MASEVDICNAALSHIGEGATVAAINPPENSVEAMHCARFYPMARDAMLEAHAWRFNTKRADLAELADNPQEAIWGFAYQLPNLCLRPLRVLQPDTSDDFKGQPFEVETDTDGSLILFTNVEDAVLVYCAKVTDTAKFSPSFTIALGILVGHFLAGPITKDLKLKAGLYQAYLAAGGPPIQAAALDANARKNTGYGANHLPGHLEARR